MNDDYDEEELLEYDDSEVNMGHNNGRQNRRKKKRRKLILRNKIIVGVVSILFLALVVILGFYIYVDDKINLMNYVPRGDIVIDNNATVSPDDLVDGKNIDQALKDIINADALDFFNSVETVSANYVTNILLIGTDVRVTDEWNGNSDSMILVSINSKTKKVYMTSFMRDLYVYVPVAEKYCKLNYAHALAGSELLLDTISGNFKIKVSKYMRVDFYGLMTIIDAAGGVTLDVTPEEAAVANKEYINEMSKYMGVNPAEHYLSTAGGTMNLSGMQAVAFSRIRYVGNADYERTNRQRRVLEQLFNNCKSMSLPQINSFAEDALPNITTNISHDEVWSLISNALTYLGYDLVMQRVPFDDLYSIQTIEQQGMLVPDYQATAERLISTIYATE